MSPSTLASRPTLSLGLVRSSRCQRRRSTDQRLLVQGQQSAPLFGCLGDLRGLIADLMEVGDTSSDKSALLVVAEPDEDALEQGDALVINAPHPFLDGLRVMGPGTDGGIVLRVVFAFPDEHVEQRVHLVGRIVADSFDGLEDRIGIARFPVRQQTQEQLVAIAEVVVEAACSDAEQLGQWLYLDAIDALFNQDAASDPQPVRAITTWRLV